MCLDIAVAEETGFSNSDASQTRSWREFRLLWVFGNIHSMPTLHFSFKKFLLYENHKDHILIVGINETELTVRIKSGC